MKPKVLVTPNIYEESLTYLKNYCEVTVIEQISLVPYQTEILSEVEGILNFGLRVDEKLLNDTPKLRIVSNISVGYDNLDIEALKKRNILVTNTPDVLTDTTADAVMGILLATARRIPELDHYVKSKQWKGLIEEDLFGIDVYGKTLGIIGMGRIGSAIAKRAHFGFDMKILYHNRKRNIEVEEWLPCQYCSLEELLTQSDFVCLMTPLTKETKYLMTKNEFKKMKNTAIFINASRGQTVKEEDLIYALENNWIYAAGLDVYEKEPIEPDNSLLTFNNVVTLPHIGGATKKTRLNMVNLAIENLIVGLSGKTPPNLVKELND